MRSRRRPGALAATLLFLVLGAAFVTQVVPYKQIVETQRSVTEAGERLAALTEENERLAADAAALQTDAEIEKLAREKLGYVRPGEIAYVVVHPAGGGGDPETPPPPEPADPETWVDKVWDFLTGADTGSG